MKNFNLTMVFLLMTIFLFAEIPAGYYNAAQNIYGEELKAVLHNIIDNHNSLGYSAAKEQMFGYIDNENGQVRGVYTGEWYSIPEGEMPNQNTFNCEHTFPQSWFGSSESSTKKADLHHLFPTFATVNSSRGNLPFDEVVNIENTYGNSNWQSFRGDNENGVRVFEPADQHKGDVARAMLYFSVRYNMDLNQAAQDNGYYNVDMFHTLLDWCEFDPVDQKEIARNDAIYELQNNRNPFIDHPEYVDYIWNNVENYDDVQQVAIRSLQVFPNPYSYNSSSRNGNITISFTLDKELQANVKVANIKGQTIDTITKSTRFMRGENTLNWDGMNTSNNKVASGIYFIIFQSDAVQKISKIIILN